MGRLSANNPTTPGWWGKTDGGVMKSLLRVVISLAFVGLLVFMIRKDIPTILQTLQNVNRPLFIFAVLVFLSTVAVLARRLKLIFAAEELALSLSQACNLTFIGYFFNNFLPTSVGGDIVKAMCAARITGNPVKSVTSVLMDRIFGLFTFILIPSISLFFMRGSMNPRVPVLVYSFLGFSIFCFFLLFHRGVARYFHFVERALNLFKLGTKVRQIYDGLHNFRNHKFVIAQAMLLSVLGQCVSIVALYLMALALGAPRNILVYFFLLIPVVHLISMLPSLNGLGIREMAYVYFLKNYIGTERAAALGILWLAVLILLSLIGGMIYLFRPDYHVRFKQAVTQAEGAA